MTQAEREQMAALGRRVEFYSNIADEREALLKVIDGSISTLQKKFDVFARAAEMRQYWEMVEAVCSRCEAVPGDNLQTLICKAYVKGSGVERRMMMQLCEWGVKMYPQDRAYQDVYIPTIFPHGAEQAAAARAAVADGELLEVARELGRMRNKGY